MSEKVRNPWKQIEEDKIVNTFFKQIFKIRNPTPVDPLFWHVEKSGFELINFQADLEEWCFGIWQTQPSRSRCDMSEEQIAHTDRHSHEVELLEKRKAQPSKVIWHFPESK